MQDEMRAVAAAVKDGRTHREKVVAVSAVATASSQDGALVQHLRCHCYRCLQHYAACACRGRRRSDDAFEAPAKRRSGKSLSGHQKRLRLGLAVSSAEYKKHKWGKSPKAARQRDNAKQSPRPSGTRRR